MTPPGQAEWLSDEIKHLLNFVLSLLRDFGLDDYYLELSTRETEGDKRDKFIGSDEEWAEATAVLEQAATGEGVILGGANFVFADGHAGIDWLTQANPLHASGGYLWGYPIAAFVVGTVRQVPFGARADPVRIEQVGTVGRAQPPLAR